MMLGAMWISSAPSVVFMRLSDPNAQLPAERFEKDIAGNLLIKSEPMKFNVSLTRLKERIRQNEKDEQEIERAERESGRLRFSDEDEEEDDDEEEEAKRKQRTSPPSIWHHTLDFMWRHTLYLFFVWIVICLVEGDRIITDPNLSQFNIFFEIISGYSGCGISIG